MVTLSIENINRTSPYKVIAAKGLNSVKFITQYGVKYIVGFDKTDVLTCADSYQFYITNVNKLASPSDPNLRETIIAIASEFFASSNEAMIYICDTGDGRQAIRNRLFRHWLVDCPQYDNMATLSGEVVDEDGTRNYASLVVRNDHPKIYEILEEFTQTIHLLNNKPA